MARMTDLRVLATARETAGVTLDALAVPARVHPENLCRILRGRLRARPETLDRVRRSLIALIPVKRAELVAQLGRIDALAAELANDMKAAGP